jgi:hypothetical protein
MLSDRRWQYPVIILIIYLTSAFCEGRSTDENDLSSDDIRSGPKLLSFKVFAIIGGVLSVLWALALGGFFFKRWLSRRTDQTSTA